MGMAAIELVDLQKLVWVEFRYLLTLSYVVTLSPASSSDT